MNSNLKYFLGALCLALFVTFALAQSNGNGNGNGNGNNVQPPAPAPQPVVPLDEEQAFSNFKQKYGRSYQADDEESRKSIFKANLRKAKKLQQENPEAEFGDTPFMDMTNEEFSARFLSRLSEEELNLDTAPTTVLPEDPDFAAFADHERARRARSVEEVAPANFDWRSRNVMTPIKNQRSCGSCWAFSAVATIESALAIAGQPLLSLSEQQLVDCDETNYGCSGGWPGRAYDSIIGDGGIMSNASYPYKAANGQCQFNECRAVAKVRGWSFVSRASARNEAGMVQASYDSGPLSVCLCSASWQYYSRGILKSCCTSLDHCVQLSGWGQTTTGEKYWTLRNSWGAGWGEQGFIRISRGTNTCRIADYVTKVIV